MGGKILLTNYMNTTLCALYLNNEIVELNLCDSEDIISNIYIGQIKDVVKNLDAVFVEYKPGKVGYLPISLIPKSIKVVSGSQFPVQIQKTDVGEKAPVLTTQLSLTGKYCVITKKDTGIAFSSKIHDDTYIENTKALINNHIFNSDTFSNNNFVIIRTNAYNTDIDTLLAEIKDLIIKLDDITNKAPSRAVFSLLHDNSKSYYSFINNAYTSIYNEIVTDSIDIYNSINKDIALSDTQTLTLYNDDKLPLASMYNINKTLEHMLSKRVWLESGGYIIIDETEALTSIDVNTGHSDVKGDKTKNVHTTNYEAAVQIAKQLRLRNISGIIIVDFINIDVKSDIGSFISFLKNELAKDPVKTSYIDITKLGLVEITRKKIRKKFSEQYRKTTN